MSIMIVALAVAVAFIIASIAVWRYLEKHPEEEKKLLDEDDYMPWYMWLIVVLGILLVAGSFYSIVYSICS